jgi:glycosyltransferase involved in cell wall biosynthesis
VRVRVLIDTTFERRGPSGTGVYLRGLIGALQRAGIDVLEAANHRRRAPAGGGPGSVRNLIDDRWWTEVELPRWARRLRADLLHHPLPALASRAPCPQVITVHDLAFEAWPGLFAPRFRVWAAHSHRAAGRRARALVCVSQATAADVRARWGIEEERIVVAPHGPGQFGAGAGGAWTGSGHHFLYVGDDEPRKNLDVLLEAYRRYRGRPGPLPLVLAGGAAGSGAGVESVAHPDAGHLGELYAQAAALVHPARHEGFGLTLLEAMYLGVPVVCADSAGAREVCAGAARYVEADDAGALAAELERVARDDALRRELSRLGQERAAEFSWERSARAHIQAYTLALR